MAKKSIVAAFIIGNKKYSIESDCIVDVELNNGKSYEKIRVVGVGSMNDTLRAVNEDGIIEIPFKNIKTVRDTNEGDFSGVTTTIK